MTTAETNVDKSRFQRMLAHVSPMQSKIASKNTQPCAVVWNLPGFSGKAHVETMFGNLPIEALRVRDELRTSSGAITRVQWIDKLHLDEDYLKKHPSALPIRIAANSFGMGKPMQDLSVSPRQEVCPNAHAATSFLRAEELRSRFNAHCIQSAVGTTYYRFHCGEPVVIRVEGVWVIVRP